MSCDHPKDSHYGVYCPLCSEITAMRTVRVFEFFRTATRIAAKEGYSWEGSGDTWVRNVLHHLHYDISNDSYYDIDLNIDEDDPQCMVEFKTGLLKYTDLKPTDDILLFVSW